MMKVLPVMVLATLASGAAAEWTPAVEKRLSPAYRDCFASGTDASHGVTSAMMSCSGEEIDRQDARLNQAYTMVMARLPTARRTALRQSQRAWIKRRDAAATAAGHAAGGGSASGLEYSSVILNQTIVRLMWLEKYR